MLDLQRIRSHQEDEVKILSDTRDYVLRRDGYACQYCAEDKEDYLTVHHVLFRSQGGDHDPENLVTLCVKCHECIHNTTLYVRRINGCWYFYNPIYNKELSNATVVANRLRRYHRWSLNQWKSAKQ